MTIHNPIGTCLAEVKKLSRLDPSQRSLLGWSLTRRMLDEVVSLSELGRRDLSQRLTREETGFLFGIAFGGAVDAIREADPNYLRDGLLALLIEGSKMDYRETVKHLSLLNHSAAKLHVDFADMYSTIQRFSNQAMHELIKQWISAGSKDIGMMGYEEGTLQDGRFTYVSA